jgi:Tol biopolymer transport system component
MIVFRASRDTSGSRLWIRRLNDPTARPIDGTQDGMNPAFSLDGQWIAFITDNVNIKKVRASGGPVTPVVHTSARTAALSWGDKDEIFFEQIGPIAGIQRVSANAGRQALAVPLDTANKETGQRRPLFIRSAGVIVYGSSVADGEEPTLVFYQLSSGRRLRSEISGIGPLAVLGDLLVYSRADGTLMSVQINAGAMKIIGTPVALEPRVAAAGTGTAVTLSDEGTLVYQPADDAGGTTLALVDTSGQVRPLRGRFAVQTPLRFSPDGKQIAIGSRDVAASAAGARAEDVRVLDITTQVATRLRTSGNALRVSWFHDGHRLVVPVEANDSSDLLTVPLDGTAESRLVRFGGQILEATSVAPDGKSYVIEARVERPPGTAMLRVWVDGSAKVDTLLAPGSGLRPSMSRLSPDGRLVAFLDRNTNNVYVLAVAGGGTLQVSEIAAGFMRPVVWGPDSRRLYYVAANGLNVIEVDLSPVLRVVKRAARSNFPLSRNYDLAPDGRTFVMANPLEHAVGVQLAVNWGAEARRMWSDGQR